MQHDLSLSLTVLVWIFIATAVILLIVRLRHEVTRRKRRTDNKRFEELYDSLYKSYARIDEVDEKMNQQGERMKILLQDLQAKVKHLYEMKDPGPGFRIKKTTLTRDDSQPYTDEKAPDLKFFSVITIAKADRDKLGTAIGFILDNKSGRIAVIHEKEIEEGKGLELTIAYDNIKTLADCFFYLGISTTYESINIHRKEMEHVADFLKSVLKEETPTQTAN